MRFLTALQEPRRQVVAFVVLLFVTLLPLLPSAAKYHGDECFYTDAAIRMLQTGDYLTPYAASGALRFAKPIVPYWSVLVSYLVFGVNLFASRLLFLTAGCAIVYVTYRIGLAVFEKPRVAILSALILGSNVQLLTISIRSTPDAFLALFVAVSLLGFAHILFGSERTWKHYVCAYVGAALAVQTRGLPGVAVLGFGFVFWALAARKVVPLRRLLNARAIVLALLVGSSWFAAMFWLHRQEFINGFYYDQVTENVRSYEYLDSLRNLKTYAVGLLRHFLPWSALLIVGLLVDRSRAAAFWRENRSRCWFLVGWYLFILTPFIFGGFSRTRYMIVAYPTLAVFLAGVLDRYAEDVRFQRWCGRVAGGAAIVMIILGVALVPAGLRIHARIWLGGLLLAGCGAAVWLAFRRGAQPARWAGIAALSLGAFWAVELFLRPVFASSPAAALVAKLLPDGVGRAKAYTINLSPALQAQLRVFSHGQLTVTALPPNSAAVTNAAEPVVFSEQDKALFQDQTNRIQQVGFVSRKWRARDFADLLSPTRKEAAFQRNLAPFYILQPARP